jgi:hypothetical protein
MTPRGVVFILIGLLSHD